MDASQELMDERREQLDAWLKQCAALLASEPSSGGCPASCSGSTLLDGTVIILPSAVALMPSVVSAGIVLLKHACLTPLVSRLAAHPFICVCAELRCFLTAPGLLSQDATWQVRIAAFAIFVGALLA